MNCACGKKKQLYIFFLMAFVGAVAGIAHGVFFDLDFSQIRRLSVLGIVFTTAIIFPTLLLIEWIFDWNNQDDLEVLKVRIDELEHKINSNV